MSPVLRTRESSGGAMRGVNLRTRNTGSQTSTFLPESPWDAHVEGWHFDEASNSTRVGIRGRDFSDVGSDTVQAAGKHGYSAYVSGSVPNELRCTTNDFRIGGDFTISMWIYPNDTWGPPNEPILRYEDGSSNADFDFYSNSLFYFRCWDSVTGSQVQYVENDWTVGQWSFVVFTYDATSKVMRAVLDDDTSFARETSALTNGLRQGGTRLRLGDSGGAASSLLWRVDETHIFAEKKSDDWIEYMYNDGLGRVHPR